MNPLSIQDVMAVIPPKAKVVFVSGDFNLVHAGHHRILDFAKECGTFLLVGVNADSIAGRAFLDEQTRCDGLVSLGIADHVFILRVPPEEFIAALRPAIVVKGPEHRNKDNPEQSAVEAYGGEILFSSGGSSTSTLEQLNYVQTDDDLVLLNTKREYSRRHNLSLEFLTEIIKKFRQLRVVVVGDLIVDEYVDCTALGMSREDPTLVVSPVMSKLFVGGAGIVASHVAGLGAQVSYFGVAADDQAGHFAAETLKKFGVNHNLVSEQGRPTTLKQRFRASQKTLLRVSHMRQHDIGENLIEQLAEGIESNLNKADLLIFSDFSYGCLPQKLVDRLNAYCQARDIPMAADSQASSQIGDVSRFKGAMLLTPTEHEARLAMSDSRNGLVVLAENLSRKAQAKYVILTLSEEGVIIYNSVSTGRQIVDHLPSFNALPKDVSGAGDSMMTCSAMALTAGADIWGAAYLGTIAAACQIRHTGNTPLNAETIIAELSR